VPSSSDEQPLAPPRAFLRLASVPPASLGEPPPPPSRTLQPRRRFIVDVKTACSLVSPRALELIRAGPCWFCPDPLRMSPVCLVFPVRSKSKLLDLGLEIIHHIFSEDENDHIQISTGYLYKYLPCRASLWSK
jgi:hypothetical protein